MMDRHEVAGKIFYLPVFFRADLFALDAAARQARSVSFNSWTWVITGKFSKLARLRRPLRRFTRRTSSSASVRMEDRTD
jgi:hypothetical protein